MIRGSPSRPIPGDVIVRAVGVRFELVDATTHTLVVRDLASLAAAVEAARRREAGAVWQQHFDNRGRALGEPFLLRRPVLPGVKVRG